MAKNYGQISLPDDLILLVREFVKEHPKLGYRSAAEFVKVAIREKIEKYEREHLG